MTMKLGRAAHSSLCTSVSLHQHSTKLDYPVSVVLQSLCLSIIADKHDPTDYLVKDTELQLLQFVIPFAINYYLNCTIFLFGNAYFYVRYFSILKCLMAIKRTN